MGQARVLLLAVLINVLSVALLVTAVQLAWPLAVSLAAAVGVGVGFSLAGSAVRARWTLRLNGSPLLNTAFALEAMLDEVVFIIGPVLVTFLATALHPALGVSVSAVIGLIGAVALAAQRSSQPPIRSTAHGHQESSRLPWRVLVPVAIASGALGMVFGGMEVNVVAFAKETGVLPYAGLILMAWSFGSLIAGAVTGAIIWRTSPAKRFRVGASLLALSLLPLPFVDAPARRCPAAHPQRNGYCANPDRIDWGNPVGGRSEPTDRGACLELDWYGRGRRRRCGSCRLRDRQFRCTVWLRCSGDCRAPADAQRPLGSWAAPGRRVGSRSDRA